MSGRATPLPPGLGRRGRPKRVGLDVATSGMRRKGWRAAINLPTMDAEVVRSGGNAVKKWTSGSKVPALDASRFNTKMIMIAIFLNRFCAGHSLNIACWRKTLKPGGECLCMEANWVWLRDSGFREHRSQSCQFDISRYSDVLKRIKTLKLIIIKMQWLQICVMCIELWM